MIVLLLFLHADHLLNISGAFLIGTLNNLHKGAQTQITESTGLGTNRITPDLLVPKTCFTYKNIHVDQALTTCVLE